MQNEKKKKKNNVKDSQEINETEKFEEIEVKQNNVMK